MGIGSAIRRRLGPCEPAAADAYRALFVNLGDFARTAASLIVPAPGEIAEIGCGDGAVADRICRAFPAARYTGIDIAREPGRLFAGDRSRASFRHMTSSELVAEAPGAFDLVLLVDVFHHLPDELRGPMIGEVDALCRPGGTIVIKDWVRGGNPAHVASILLERYLTGDRGVHYASRDELWGAIEAGLNGAELVGEARIPPRRNNILFALRKRG